MNILLTTHQLAGFAGSEIFTFELAKALAARGHQVTVYSRYVDVFEELFAKSGLELVSNLQTLQERSFDLAHVQHHINALEVRAAFPALPIFYLSHGPEAFLEKPPAIDVNIAGFGAVSQEVKRQLLKHKIKSSAITIIPNLVDEVSFSNTQPLPSQIKRALILSNKIDKKSQQRIEKACQILGITCVGVGTKFQQLNNLEIPAAINAAEVVFTLGRGVIETMMCGRIPFILDAKGGDGLLSLKNIRFSAQFNFSGRYRARHFTVAQIVTELKKYQAGDGPKLQAWARQRHSRSAVIDQLEVAYRRTLSTHRSKKINHSLIQYMVETVHVTRLHTFSRSEKKSLREMGVALWQEIKQAVKKKVGNIFFQIKNNRLRVSNAA